jgi:lysozyme
MAKWIPVAHHALAALVLVVAASCGREPPASEQEKKRPSASGAPQSAVARPGEYRMSARGLARIRESEAFIPKVYDDGVGNETIGYGHMLRPGESYAGGITEAAAETLLASDVSRIVDPALERVTVPLSQNQVDALGSFIYNVGPGNFARSVLPPLNRGDHDGVTAAMARYTKGRNQRTGERIALRGLVRRRGEEVSLYRAPAGSASSWLPGQRWSRVARRLLANGLQSLRVELTCSFDTCGHSRSLS